MDIATHALASVGLARGIFPRAPKHLWAWAGWAGVVADVDSFSEMMGPEAYLKWHRSYTHSVVACLAIPIICAFAYQVLSGAELRRRLSVGAVFATTLLAQGLHVGMDVCQWQGVAALWPFSRTKFAMDWLATVDPWLILILITALALPELFHLVSSEIGAKEKRPRGQAGALAGILAAILYVGLRAELHANVCAQLQNRTYGGELPRKTGAFADAVSLTTWKGVVETEGALHRITIHVGSATQAMTTASGENLFKPEQTRNLRAAEASEPAKRFLEVAQFPRATVQKVAAGGEEVELRDLRDGAAGELRRTIAVVVDFDANGKMVSQQLVWGNRTDLR